MDAIAYDDGSHGSITLDTSGTRISNVAEGIAAADAVNKGQMERADAATLDTSMTYTDTRESVIRSDMEAADATVLGSAKGYVDTRESVLRSDMASADTATLAGARSYTDTREAAVRDAAVAADAQTLSSANGYTDTVASQTLASAKNYADGVVSGINDQFTQVRSEMDQRFHTLDRRIDKMAAMSGAYAGMAMNTAGLPGNNRIGVGVGFQGGQKAMAIGYQRVVSPNASVSLGGAFGGGEKSVMGGAGFSW